MSNADIKDIVKQKYGQGIDVDAIAQQVEGNFRSSFMRAVKPACCA